MKRIEKAELSIRDVASTGLLLGSLMEDIHHRVDELEIEVSLLSDDYPSRTDVIEKDVSFLKEMVVQFAGNYHPLASKFREEIENRVSALEVATKTRTEQDSSVSNKYSRQDSSVSNKYSRQDSSVSNKCSTSQTEVTTFRKETSNNIATLQKRIIELERENMLLTNKINGLENRFGFHIKQFHAFEEQIP